MSRPHERARTLGVFYALGGAVALGSVAVGAWPNTDQLRIVALGVIGLTTGGAVWLAGDRPPRHLLSLLLSVGVLLIAMGQLASGSPSAAVAYGIFYIFAVIYAVLFTGAVEMVLQLSLIVMAQVYVVQQVGSFAPGDTRGLPAHIFVTIATGVGVGWPCPTTSTDVSRQKATHWRSRSSTH